ncbi:MAG: hypothetical protein ACK55I_39570, partial [bacterium]
VRILSILHFGINHSLHSQFDPVKLRQFYSFFFDLAKFWTNLVRFASIVFGDGLNHIVFASILPSLGGIFFRFDLARVGTNMVCFRFDPAGY